MFNVVSSHKFQVKRKTLACINREHFGGGIYASNPCVGACACIIYFQSVAFIRWNYELCGDRYEFIVGIGTC